MRVVIILAVAGAVRGMPASVRSLGVCHAACEREPAGGMNTRLMEDVGAVGIAFGLMALVLSPSPAAGPVVVVRAQPKEVAGRWCVRRQPRTGGRGPGGCPVRGSGHAGREGHVRQAPGAGSTDGVLAGRTARPAQGSRGELPGRHRARGARPAAGPVKMPVPPTAAGGGGWGAGPATWSVAGPEQGPGHREAQDQPRNGARWLSVPACRRRSGTPMPPRRRTTAIVAVGRTPTSTAAKALPPGVCCEGVPPRKASRREVLPRGVPPRRRADRGPRRPGPIAAARRRKDRASLGHDARARPPGHAASQPDGAAVRRRRPGHGYLAGPSSRSCSRNWSRTAFGRSLCRAGGFRPDRLAAPGLDHLGDLSPGPGTSGPNPGPLGAR